MSVEAVTQPITFEYPAFAQDRKSLSIRAQVSGNSDLNPQEQVILFTMDGRSLSRNVSRHTKVRSEWSFTTVQNIETVRAFFRAGDGHYFKYTHFDGSEWYFILLGSSYSATSTNSKLFYYEGNIRRSLVTYDFSLSVERWAAS